MIELLLVAALAADVPEWVAERKAAVVYTLRDPDSAQFRGLVIDTEARTLCGQVNGKNAYGGYAGFERFYAVEGQPPIVEDEDSPYFRQLYANYCGNAEPLDD